MAARARPKALLTIVVHERVGVVVGRLQLEGRTQHTRTYACTWTQHRAGSTTPRAHVTHEQARQGQGAKGRGRKLRVPGVYRRRFKACAHTGGRTDLPTRRLRSLTVSAQSIECCYAPPRVTALRVAPNLRRSGTGGDGVGGKHHSFLRGRFRHRNRAPHKHVGTRTVPCRTRGALRRAFAWFTWVL